MLSLQREKMFVLPAWGMSHAGYGNIKITKKGAGGQMSDLNLENRHKCGVFLLSGFLGSGKTTLLKHIIAVKPKDKKIAVLMNEFGKAGVDGDVIRKDGLEIIEISRGSIFCACAKGDFLRALYTIFKEYRPDILLVEASGVADTTDMEKDMSNKMLGGFYSLSGNICVVDAENFINWLDVFNAVEKQVAVASKIIINKCDAVSEDKLKETDCAVRAINSHAQIIHAMFGTVPWSFIADDAPCTAAADKIPSSEEWEEFVAASLKDMKAHLSPPDNLSSLSIFWEGNALEFKKILSELPSDIVRSKGYFKDTDDNWKVFDIVGGSPAVFTDMDADDFTPAQNLAIFIRTQKARREIPKIFEEHGLKMNQVRF